MPKYVIEREVTGAGKLTAEQLTGISQTSCGVLSEMVLEHAKQGGFPANSVSLVSAIIDPATSE